uniref:BTB domain-containing protein n=1 Tax=Gasterosteus aculeatus aculeatus TaxID=481459 RepID=G3PMF0_GASAC
MSDKSKSLLESSSEFNVLRLRKEFCDAVVRVEDVAFEIHKAILSKCSMYFTALFRRWPPPDRNVFHIPGVSPRAMQLIIEFAYTGSVAVTEENVQELLLAADQLNVLDVVRSCCDFLAGLLNAENCVGVFQFTDVCFSRELRDRALSYIAGRFEEVVLSEEFLQLSACQLAIILGRDDLNVREESAAFEAVLRWIAHRPQEREGNMARLLSKVRLANLSTNYILFNVMSNKLVNNKDCQAVVADAINTISLVMKYPNSHIAKTIARPRLPNAILLAIGGWSVGDPTNSVEAYDVRTDCWLDVTNANQRPRAYHGSAVFHGSVYCVGGFDRTEHFNSVCRLELSTLTWHQAASMNHRRCYVSVSVLADFMYAMGGFNGHERLSTAERYRPDINQWKLIAPMHEQRSDASSTTLHNKVYICGGFNGTECLQTAERYDPETDQWTMISPMSCRRSGIGVTTYADQVFAVGGFDGANRLRSTEVYNPLSDAWDEVRPMLTPRSNFGIEVLDGSLFVVGGFNGMTTTNHVEHYDAATGEWTEACSMDVFRSALSCCVFSRLANMSGW